MEQINYFTLYESQVKTLSKMDGENVKKYLLAVIDYCKNGTVPDFDYDIISDVLWDNHKPIIDKNNKRFLASRENGKKGGRPQKQKGEGKIDQTEQQPTPVNSKKLVAKEIDENDMPF